MSYMEMLQSTEFWIGLLKIIWVNLILSGDNAVVIALAARSLPPKQQKLAIFWGSGAAVGLRIVLTLFAVALLTLPYLKLIGAALLVWIGIQLLTPDDGDADITGHDNLYAAIKTILIADLVMSLDNVIGVAAAAKGNVVLLILGLAISIPLVIFGSTLLLKLMERAPVIITLGAALLGYVAGEMAESDPASADWVAANVPFHTFHVVPGILEISLLGLIGAVIVVGTGKWLTHRHQQAQRKGHA